VTELDHDGEFYWKKWATIESANRHKWIWFKILALESALSSYPISGTRYIMNQIPTEVEEAKESEWISYAWDNERVRVVTAFCEASAKVCLERNLEDDSDDANMVFEEAFDIFSHIEGADLGDIYKDKDWHAKSQRLRVTKDGAFIRPFLSDDLAIIHDRWQKYHSWSSENLALVTSEYIKSPFKSAFLDRFLLKVIIEGEANNYLHAVKFEPVFNNEISKFQKNALYESKMRHWRSRLLFKIISSIVIALAAHPLWALLLIGESYDFVPWILSALSIYIGCFSIPSALNEVEDYKTHNSLFERLLFLGECQRMVKSEGLVSILLLRKQLSKREEYEVKFINPLDVLLEDIEARGLASV
jgi:hypothetical protein